MKTKTAIVLLSLASFAASAQVCACGSDHTASAAPIDAAAGDVEVAIMDGALETSAETGSDASDGGLTVRATQLLDDMRGTAILARWYLTDGPGTSGVWYTYSDRTVPWSEPPIFVSDAGLLVPSDGLPFPAADDGVGPSYLGSAQPYRRCSGGGEGYWGIGFGMDFTDVTPDGGDVPPNDCEAGMIFDVDAAAGDSVIPRPFDASGWTGIQFWGKSLRADFAQPVFVELHDETTTPFGLAVDAGGCNPCNASGLGVCGDGFKARVLFPTDWTQIRIPFGAMHPDGYSGSSKFAVPDVSKILQLNFQIELTAGELAPFDVAVAYVELYK